MEQENKSPELTQEVRIPKKRGRKPKDPNAVPTVKIPKKRGRKPKDPNAPPKVKGKRGRKPRDPNAPKKGPYQKMIPVDFSKLDLKGARFAAAAECIIKHVRHRMITGELKKGDRLPAERKLSEQLGVSRNHVKDALNKMAFFGMIKTMPQSGSTVTGTNPNVLKNVFSNVFLVEEEFGLTSLVETRIVLEVAAIRLAAERRTDADLANIENALQNHIKAVESGKSHEELDFELHLAIAQATQSPVLEAMVTCIAPEMLRHYVKHEICRENGAKAISEHKAMVEAIKNRDANEAERLLKQHILEESPWKSA